MRGDWPIAVLSITIALATICPGLAGQQSASTHPHAKRSEGFLDYALGKINPNDKDYGSSAAKARSELVADTIHDLYFWSNVVSLALLSATSVALILVLRTQNKREIIAASILAQLWNGRVVDRREITRRTRMYNALVETRNAALEKKPPPSQEESNPSTSPTSSLPEEKTGKQTRMRTDKASTAQPAASPSPVPVRGLPSLNWEEKARLLEGQNQALRNTERNLKERLNQASHDLEQERRRNRTLKGA